MQGPGPASDESLKEPWKGGRAIHRTLKVLDVGACRIITPERAVEMLRLVLPRKGEARHHRAQVRKHHTTVRRLLAEAHQAPLLVA